MNKAKHILRWLLLFILAAMAVAPSMAQTNTVYAGQTSQLSVVEVPGGSYTWDLYIDDVSINFGIVPGNCPVTSAHFNGSNTAAVVSVTWLIPGVYYYKVTIVNAEGCSNIAIGMMTVLNAIPLAEIEPLTPVCSGNSTSLVINLTGTAPWSIDLSDGTSTITYDNILSSPFTSLVAPLVSANYTVTRVSDAYGQNLNHSNTVTLVVKPRPLTSPIIQYGP